MNIIPIQDVCFDDEATLAMGAAFDQACKLLRHSGSDVIVREIVAKRIIKAAKNGERDSVQLCGKSLKAFSIEEMSVPVTGVDRNPPIPVHASITQAA